MQLNRPRLITLIGVIFCFFALILGSAFAKEDAQKEELPVADLQRFTKVIEYIKEFYVKPVNDTELFENALHGMLAGLDPHSSYLDTAEFADLKSSTTGKFGGLGVEVLPEDGFIRVISPIDDSPAQRAGIQAGDLIIRLNETPVKGLTTDEALKLMRGEKGTKITLTIIRQGENKPLQIPVVRDIINVQSIRNKMLDDNFAYLRVSVFQSNSGDDLTRVIQTLKKTNKGKLKGVILDLRNNPGGVLDSAVQVADIFLDRDKIKQYDGVIVYTKGRIPGTQIKEKAHSGDILNGAPVVVLVNSGSASASEIVAGALQDYRRAVIVGTQTFGKGSVQTVLPLKGERGLKLTTALYYTPAGRSIQATGIKPDITVQNLRIPAPTTKEDQALLLREEDIQGHLANGNDKNAEKQPGVTDKKPTPESATANLLYTDYQLYQALNILKGLTLYAGKEVTNN